MIIEYKALKKSTVRPETSVYITGGPAGSVCPATVLLMMK